MSDTFTVFYDNTSKEIAYALRGTATSEQISAEASAGRGYVTTTRSDDVATNHFYINADEDDIVEYSTFSISVSPANGQCAVDETFTLTGVPEGTKVYGGGVLLGTMNSDSSLTLTAKEAGVWRILFEKTNYYQGEVSLYVKRRGE